MKDLIIEDDSAIGDYVLLGALATWGPHTGAEAASADLAAEALLHLGADPDLHLVCQRSTLGIGPDSGGQPALLVGYRGRSREHVAPGSRSSPYDEVFGTNAAAIAGYHEAPLVHDRNLRVEKGCGGQ